MKEKYWDIVIPTAAHGGVENCINNLSTELSRIGYKIRIIQLISEGAKWVDEGTAFYELTYGKDGHSVNELAERYAKFLLENEAPEVIIAANWPICVYITKLAVAALGEKIHILSWLHNPVERYVAAGYGGFEYLGLADGHLAISDYIFQEIKQNLNLQNVYRVKNPVVFTSVGENRLNRGDSDSCKLAFIGRITPVKGLDIILQALALADTNWELTVIGEPETEEYRNKIDSLIVNLGINNAVKMLGWQENPWAYTQDIDFICMPSIYEGFPLVAIESLYQGIPVIATPVSGVGEIVIPGETGYLIPQQNPEELAAVLDYIAKGTLPIPSGDRCRDMVYPAFDLKNVAKEFGEIVTLACKMQN